MFYEDDFQTYWAVVDTVTGDTILSDQTMQFAYKELVVDSLAAFFPIAKGMQIAVFNGERKPASWTQTAFAGTDTTLALAVDWGITNSVFGVPQSAWGSDKHFRADYELRYTGTPENYFDLYDGVSPVTAPFEVWNVTDNYRVHIEIWDWNVDGSFTPSDDPNQGDMIAITNVPYSGSPQTSAYPTYHTWLFSLDSAKFQNAQPGDVLTVAGAPLNGPADEFYFSPDRIDLSLAKRELSDIKVVPNPYIARAAWENNTIPTKMQFTHLPGECTIRVYTLAGDLVKTIEHTSGDGDEDWNLLSSSGQLVASGMYFFHVSSPVGEYLGRFAIIN